MDANQTVLFLSTSETSESLNASFSSFIFRFLSLTKNAIASMARATKNATEIVTPKNPDFCVSLNLLNINMLVDEIIVPNTALAAK